MDQTRIFKVAQFKRDTFVLNFNSYLRICCNHNSRAQWCNDN